MNTHLDCVPCLLRQSLEAARYVTDDSELHEQVIRDVLRLAAEVDLRRPPPAVGQAVHRRLRELTGHSDPYLDAKRRFNRLVLAELPDLAAITRRADDPLLAAATCAVAANAIDLGPTTTTDDEVRAALRRSPEVAVEGDWEQFLEAAVGADHILYLADNAGEIAVDRLVVEALGPERVTVAVRGAPVLNDATLADAREVGLTEIVEVIDNGSDAPGTILEECSREFRQRFDRARLVIAKGQGNFESLVGTEKAVAYWFKIKCSTVSRQVGLGVGTHVLLPPGGAREWAASSGGVR